MTLNFCIALLRFIPNRQAIDMEKAQFLLGQSSAASDSNTDAGESRSEDRILEYCIKRPNVPVREATTARPAAPRQPTRFIPSVRCLFFMVIMLN